MLVITPARPNVNARSVPRESQYVVELLIPYASWILQPFITALVMLDPIPRSSGNASLVLNVTWRMAVTPTAVSPLAAVLGTSWPALSSTQPIVSSSPTAFTSAVPMVCLRGSRLALRLRSVYQSLMVLSVATRAASVPTMATSAAISSRSLAISPPQLSTAVRQGGTQLFTRLVIKELARPRWQHSRLQRSLVTTSVLLTASV